MILLLAATALAAPLPLPMPTAPLCAPEAAASASIRAGSELEYPEWAVGLDCDSAASCLAQIRRLGDPAPEVRAQRAGELERPADDPWVQSPVYAEVELVCEHTGARAVWTCDAATCGLVTTRPGVGLAWDSPAWGTVPGHAQTTVGDLVRQSDAELTRLGPSLLADATAAAAGRLVAVLDHCEVGGCEAGWTALRRDAEALATVERPTFLSIERGMWGERGFTAHFVPAGRTAADGLEATLDCYDIRGECDMHESACTLLVAREGREPGLASSQGNLVKWGDASFGITTVGRAGFGYVHTEGHSAR